MKIKLLAITIIFLGIIIFVSSKGKSDQLESDSAGDIKQYVITEAYKYPVVPGTDEWKSFPSVIEKRKACYVAPELLSKMTTSALVETIITYPLFIDIKMFDTLNLGVNWVSNYFGGFSELEKRSDAYDCIVDYINKNSDIGEENNQFLLNAKTLKDYYDRYINDFFV